MVVFAPGAPVALAALEPAIVMLLGGEPVGERFIEWNFVSSSRERIEQAKADWRAGRMKLPDLDDARVHPAARRVDAGSATVQHRAPNDPGCCGRVRSVVATGVAAEEPPAAAGAARIQRA